MRTTLYVWLWVLVQAGVTAATLEFGRVGNAQFPSAGQEVFAGAWGDYDGDGRPDLFLCGLGDYPGLLYRNTVAGFVPVSGGALAEDVVPRAGAAWGDLNNDGALDLYVAGAYGRADRVYVNDGAGGFRRIAVDGIAEGHGISVVWSDMDRDGWLDVLAVNGGGAASEPSFVLRNDGKGGLTRRMEGELAGYAQYSHGASFGDYDGDGDEDLLFTSAWNQPNALFRNEGGGFFVRTTHGEVGATGFGGAAIGAWADYDNDGDLDLLLVNSSAGNVLFRNQAGKLERLPGGELGGGTGDPVGAAWADLDNDGFLDVVVARRTATPLVYMGGSDGRFQAVEVRGFDLEGFPANGLAVADYDLDGDLDVWFSNWGPSAIFTSLFRNNTTAGRYLRIRLEGRQSNRAGIGARIRVRTVVEGREVWQLRVVGGFDGLGSHELIAHFGLGTAVEATQVRVEWPSGKVQELGAIPGNQVLLIQEPPAAPLEIDPAGGEFEGSVQLTLRSNVGGAEVRFTTDGTDPTAGSALYTGRLTLTSRTTIKARLFVNGFPVSDVSTAVFIPKPPLKLVPAGGFFTNAVDVVLTSSLVNSEIRYSLDGSDPTLQSPRYDQAIRLTTSTTVAARAFINGFPVTEVIRGEFRRVYVAGDDGIPAAWREQYFGKDYATDVRAPAEADPDGDGTNNRQEWAAGTNPLDPLSGFRLGVRAVPEIRFASVAGKTYRILRMSDVTGSGLTVVASIRATGVETVWVDTEAGAVVNPAFYVVQPEP